MMFFLLILSHLAIGQPANLDTVSAQFEKRINLQFSTIQRQNPDVSWPKIDVTFEKYLNETNLDYSDQNSVKSKILAFCQEVTERYQNKVVKSAKLPEDGSYFAQSCALVEIQMQGTGVVFDQSNINLVDRFVLLQHHTALVTLLKAPYFSMMQEMRSYQLAYKTSIFGIIGFSYQLFYILTQIAVFLVFGFFTFKLFKFLVP